jgi:THO complex subunit 1
MVETVLSRDKNWARWKIDNCPSIAKPAVTPEEYAESKVSASKVTANKDLSTSNFSTKAAVKVTWIG